jgi:CubicO group peptidase (beta-lactamase class C family)
MTRDRHASQSTPHQIGALVTLLIVALWSTAVVWIHTVTPASGDTREMAFMGTVAIMSWLLLPLYWRRVRWSYVGGILVTVLLLVGAAIIIPYRVIHFSPSVYNLSVPLAYAAALACAYFSVRSFRQRPSSSRRGILLGVGATVLILAAIAGLLFSNQAFIRRFTVKSTLRRAYRQLERREALEDKIQYLMDLGAIPSLSVGIVVNDSLVWARAFGEQDSLDTVYNIGSITKPIVATAVLQLHEGGLIDLDDDVNEYLPFSLRHPRYPQKPITIRMLLTHQSGLASTRIAQESYFRDETIIEWVVAERGWSMADHDLQLPLAEFLESYLVPGGQYYSPEIWSSVEPGTKSTYANSGYFLLRCIVEHVTGQLLTDYLQENVLTPLDMGHTGFRFSDSPQNQAVPYLRIFGILSKTNIEVPLHDRVIGAGGIRSTVPDLARFMIAHLNEGRLDGTQLLEPETVALMHEQVVASAAVTNMVSTGLGIDKLREGPGQYWGHAYDMHGALGHQGGDFGCDNEWWFVGKGSGGYGAIMLKNVNTHKWDEALYFATHYKILVLLMEEAAERYQQQLGQ